jgi:23S rRNA (cytosine1962-C5)-methyltransferase
MSDILQDITHCQSIFERSDVEVRNLEGLPLRIGSLRGDEIVEDIPITENGIKYLVDIRSGQKTGFYLDQRKNRLIVRSLSSGRDVLDCFCYTGGFSLNALAGNARSVWAVDSSANHLENAKKNLNLNAYSENRVEWIGEDVFQVLRKYRDRGLTFDLIILDPPKFAPTAAQVQRASRAYKDINLLAMKLLRDQGLLVTFSCSGAISEELFQKIIAGAALDANKRVKILERLNQDFDHTVAIEYPEGWYLKGFVLSVSGV